MTTGKRRARLYRFNLEVLLNHQRFIEDEHQKALAEIRLQLDAQTDVLERLLQKEADMTAQFKKKQNGALSSDDLILYRHYFDRLREDVASQRELTRETERCFRVKQKELLEAVKKREMLEQLRKKGLSAYHEKLLRKEQADLNEIALGAYNRNRMPS
ncbi:MAG: flagellar export protein FliJ [Desulfosarcinaceae bacterium]|nr:flagellar export protein FliJ [Desulfosarcinaceae bacterium]